MSEVSKFLRVLKKYWYILILVPLIAVITTYFFVRKQPDSYVSHVRLSTGLVNKSYNFLKTEFMELSQVNQQFSNILQLMESRKIVNQVSYLLIIHDFTQTPFRKPSKLVNELNASARQFVVNTCKAKYQKREDLFLYSDKEKGIERVLGSMGYDYGSLSYNLNIFRVNYGDYIDAEFTSDNPELSAFVVNTLANEFLSYYKLTVKESNLRAINFLDSLVKVKQTSMNLKMENLKNYKIRNRVLNLQEQAKSTYGQIAEIEMKREMANKDIESYSAAIQQIDRKFNPHDRRYIESALININQDLLTGREQLKNANNEYIQSGFDARYKKKVDSIQNNLTAKIAQSTDHYIYNPLSSKDNLVVQKLNLEIALDLAKNSLGVINNEVIRLNNKIDHLVPNEASIQAYESDIDIASKEYIELLQKLNQTSMETSVSSKLNIVETGMPGDAKPSKKMLLVVLAGAISFILCLAVLFILFYFDNAIREPSQLANYSGSPVLGTIPLMSNNSQRVIDLWSTENLSLEQDKLKVALRSLRFEIEKEMGTDKILGVTALCSKDGVSYLCSCIAQSFAGMNKKVLLIDGNFSNPALSTIYKADYFIEEFLKDGYSKIGPTGSVTILGSQGGKYSLLELADENSIRNKMNELKKIFDLIIVDMSSLETPDKSKEWIMFTEKLISTFNNNTVISGSKKINTSYLVNLPSQFKGWVFNRV